MISRVRLYLKMGRFTLGVGEFAVGLSTEEEQYS